MLFTFILQAIIGFTVTFFSLPFLEKWQKEKKIIAPDIHKLDKQLKPKMGGISIVIAFLIAIATILPLVQKPSLFIFTLVTIALVSLVGIYDDLFNLRQHTKVILICLCAIPLAWLMKDQATIYFPYIGLINFYVFYPFVLVPFGITSSANLTNMLAGYNGLEAGTGVLALFSVFVIALILGKPEATAISLPMTFALLAFLRHNWYPARIFPGDTGTLIIGAAIGCSCIIGGFEILAILTLVPHIVDFLLKLIDAVMHRSTPFSQRRTYGDTKISADGKLIPPSYLALTHVIMRVKPMSEKQLVTTMIFLEAICCATAILLAI